MYYGFVVTNNEPCLVTKELYAVIAKMKLEGKFGHQIGFMLEMNLDRTRLNFGQGDLELVISLEEYVQKYTKGGSGEGRSILIE